MQKCKKNKIKCKKKKAHCEVWLRFVLNFFTTTQKQSTERENSLKVNSVNTRHAKQRTVLEEVRGESVIRRVPETAAADLHALPGELADVDQDDNFVSGDH